MPSQTEKLHHNGMTGQSVKVENGGQTMGSSAGLDRRNIAHFDSDNHDRDSSSVPTKHDGYLRMRKQDGNLQNESIGSDTAISRKRSRSGTPIRMSRQHNHDGGDRQSRGDRRKDAIADAITQRYIRHDFQHRYAQECDRWTQETLTAKKERECLTWLKLRGTPVNTADENWRRKPLTEYPVLPLQNPALFYGPGYGQYGTVANRTINQPSIIYPGRRPRVGGRKTRELRIPQKEVDKHADQAEELVPIRLDIDWEKVRLRDTFTWNLHDRIIPLDLFAQQLVEDFGIPIATNDGAVRQVISSMQEQLQDHFPHPVILGGQDDPPLPYSAYRDDEIRITIRLNITIGSHTLVDQFEWDLNNSNDAPELFAQCLARELALSGEFITAIAHDIREQAQLFTRSLYIVGHSFDGQPVLDQDLQAAMQPSPMPSSFRPYFAAKEYAPVLYELNEADMERTETVLSREDRRQKRAVNRRGGPALPDLKDRRKTIRTMIVSSLIPNSAETIEASRVWKRTSSSKSKRISQGMKDDFEDTEGSGSEESQASSPAVPTYAVSGGTARTRGMRGAASAAQAAIKGSMMRSLTPDFELPAASAPRRDFGRRRDLREESFEEARPSLFVKLRIRPARLRQFQREWRAVSAGRPHESPHRRTNSTISAQSTPRLSTATATTTGLVETPMNTNLTSAVGLQSPNKPQNSNTSSNPHSAQLGRVEARGPPSAEFPVPAPPDWLQDSLIRLNKVYPHDQFEGTMRYTPVSRETDLPVLGTEWKTSNKVPEHIKMMYYPRIKCLDCPGKLYTPGPETGVTNFEVHLKNKLHRERVTERRRKQAGNPD